MNNIALKDTLKLWQMKTPLEGDHLSDSTLDGLLKGQSSDAVFEHLSRCNGCRQKLWKRQQAADVVSHKAADDYVYPLAANVGIPQEAVWITADEKYRIEFRRIISDTANRAVLVLKVQPPFDFSGRMIVVRDANDKLLLRGQISRDGRVATIVEDIDSLNLKRCIITEE
jgi:hypothetical protein